MLNERQRAAIAQASEELGLPTWYRSSVSPLLNLDPDRMPSCCGGGCEPCADTLIAVAERAREILARGDDAEGATTRS